MSRVLRDLRLSMKIERKLANQTNLTQRPLIAHSIPCEAMYCFFIAFFARTGVTLLCSMFGELQAVYA